MTFNWKNIVGSVVRNATRFNNTHTSQSPFWFIVAELCGLGSTSAIELCKEFGVDPHTKLPPSDIEEVAKEIALLYADDSVTLDGFVRGVMEAIDERTGH